MHVGYMIKSRFSATSLCLGVDTEQRSWCGTPKGTRMRSVTLNDPSYDLRFQGHAIIRHPRNGIHSYNGNTDVLNGATLNDLDFE